MRIVASEEKQNLEEEEKMAGKPVKPTRTMESSLSRLTASTRLPWLVLFRVGSCPAYVMVCSFGSW